MVLLLVKSGSCSVCTGGRGNESLEKEVLERQIMGKNKKRERPRRRWQQDAVDDLRMDAAAAAAGRLAYNLEAYRRAVDQGKFRKEHANN